MPDENELRAQLKRLGDELDRRVPIVSTLDDRYDGGYPLPPLVQEAKVTRAYRTLMDLAGSNWAKLIVDSVEERLEIQGIRFGDGQADEQAWDIFQSNGLDAESSMLHQSTLTDARAYAIVWGDGATDPEPKVTLEHASLCVCEYEAGSRRKAAAALRRWKDGKRWYANLYRPEAIYKFQSQSDGDEIPVEAQSWVRREPDGEQWPLVNPFGDVPVVEFAVNRTLRPARFGTGVGEFEPNLRHMDRINYKMFCGLVALTWSGFPLRALIGDPILRDDDGKPLKPFDVVASELVQIENPDGKLVQLPEAKIDNYSPEMDIKHLAALTKTPASYLLPGMINLSDDAIRGMERALVAKAKRHHRSLGEAWEDVVRLALRVKDPDDPRGRDQSAQIIWTDPESRSLAERADAAVKLDAIGIPKGVIMSKVLGMTPQEIARAKTEGGDDILESLMRANGTENEPVVNQQSDAVDPARGNGAGNE